MSNSQNIVVVPDFNPLKTKRSHSHCYWHYFRDLKKKLQSFHCHLYPGFCGIEECNPTSSWLPFVNCKQKKFLLGEDSLASLKNWINIETVLESLNELLVVPRNESQEIRTEAIKWLKNAAPKLKINFLPSHPYQKISSSAIRSTKES